MKNLKLYGIPLFILSGGWLLLPNAFSGVEPTNPFSLQEERTRHAEVQQLQSKDKTLSPQTLKFWAHVHQNLRAIHQACQAHAQRPDFAFILEENPEDSSLKWIPTSRLPPRSLSLDEKTGDLLLQLFALATQESSLKHSSSLPTYESNPHPTPLTLKLLVSLIEIYPRCLKKALPLSIQNQIESMLSFEALHSHSLFSQTQKDLYENSCFQPRSPFSPQSSWLKIKPILENFTLNDHPFPSTPFPITSNEVENSDALELEFIKKRTSHHLIARSPHASTGSLREDPRFALWNELLIHAFDQDQGSFFKNFLLENEDQDSTPLKTIHSWDTLCQHAPTGPFTLDSSPSLPPLKDLNDPECFKRITRLDSQKLVTLALLFTLEDTGCSDLLILQKGDHHQLGFLDHGAALSANSSYLSPRFTSCILDLPHLDEPIDPALQTFLSQLHVEQTMKKMRSKLESLGRAIHPTEYEQKMNHFRANLELMKQGVDQKLTLKQILALRIPPFKSLYHGGKALDMDMKRAKRIQDGDREFLESMKPLYFQLSAWDRAMTHAQGEIPPQREEPGTPSRLILRSGPSRAPATLHSFSSTHPSERSVIGAQKHFDIKRFQKELHSEIKQIREVDLKIFLGEPNRALYHFFRF